MSLLMLIMYYMAGWEEVADEQQEAKRE